MLQNVAHSFLLFGSKRIGIRNRIIHDIVGYECYSRSTLFSADQFVQMLLIGRSVEINQLQVYIPVVRRSIFTIVSIRASSRIRFRKDMSQSQEMSQFVRQCTGYIRISPSGCSGESGSEKSYT